MGHTRVGTLAIFLYYWMSSGKFHIGWVNLWAVFIDYYVIMLSAQFVGCNATYTVVKVGGRWVKVLQLR